jgi:hypothetical protein
MGSNLGIITPSIDENDVLKDALRPGTVTGVTDKIISSATFRSKMLDAGVQSNSEFKNLSIATGAISEMTNRSIPSSKVDQILDVTTITNPATIINDTLSDNHTSLFRGNSSNNQSYSDDLVAATSQKQNLVAQSHIISSISARDEFSDITFVCVDGVYSPETVSGAKETLTTDGVLDKRTKGRCCVYQVIGLDGNVDVPRSVEVAQYVAQNCRYDNVNLSYDNYHVSGALTSSIVIETPEVLINEETRFKMNAETSYQGNQIASNEFVQLSPFPS